MQKFRPFQSTAELLRLRHTSCAEDAEFAGAGGNGRVPGYRGEQHQTERTAYPLPLPRLLPPRLPHEEREQRERSMSTLATEACAVLFRAQHGVITRRQALTAGLTPRQIAYRIETKVWLPIGTSVYRHNTRRSTWRSNLLGVALELDAIASHRSAAALWGIDGFDDDPIEVTIGRTTGLHRPHIRLHRTTQWNLRDEVICDGIPTTGINRTLLDLAAVVGRRRLRQAVDDARRRELTDWSDLLATLEAHAVRGRNGAGKLRSFLDHHYGENTIPLSDWSNLVADLLETSGLGRPVFEHPVRVETGQVFKLDLAYPTERVGIELDSVRYHLNLESFHNDPRRRNLLENAGWTVRNFTWADYRDRPHDLADTVRAALDLRQLQILH